MKSIIAGVSIAVALASPLASRPYAISSINNVTVHFDNGECGYVYNGLPHTGYIGSFWRPDPLNGVFTWGFTQDDRELNFVPAPC